MIKKSVLLTALAIAGFAVTSLAQTVPSNVPTNGLVGWWPFNGNAIDESVNTNDGTVNGAALTADRFGNANSAYSFNGINQKVVIADHNTLSFTNSIYSFSYWAKINSNIITSGAAIYCKYGITTNFEYANVLYSSNSLNFGSGNLAGTCGAQGGSANTTNLYNIWHHFVFVADGINGSKTFVDGTLVNTGIYTACSGGNGNGNLYFGMGGGWNQQFYYNGLIDDFGIWNRALTPQEITDLYQSCSNPPTASITPQGNTTFCQGNSVTLAANTANGNTYQWYANNSAISTATNANYSATQSGSYSVVVTNGVCTATSSAVAITVNTPPSSNVSASGPTTFCSGNTITLTAQGTGTYLWSNGATTTTISVSQSGNYSVTVTANGCSSTSSVTSVTVNQTPTANITPQGSTTFCQGGFVTLNASGGGAYQWNTGATSSTVNVNQSGNYSVIVSANGCNAQTNQSVTVNPLPSVTLGTLASFVNVNEASISLSGNPSGGTYSGAGVSGNVFNPLNAGLGMHNISYNYFDANGCGGNANTNTIVYDTLGTVCTSYDTVFVSVTDTLIINTIVTGVNPPNNNNTIKVFPNPAKDHITIDYGNYVMMNGYSVKITNALGQVMFISAITQQSSYINLVSWTGNGIYFVNIINPQGNTIDIRKIVLQ